MDARDPERQVFNNLAGIRAAAPILEVGGGHGQLARALASASARVTVTGNDQSCRRPD